MCLCDGVVQNWLTCMDIHVQVQVDVDVDLHAHVHVGVYTLNCYLANRYNSVLNFVQNGHVYMRTAERIK